MAGAATWIEMDPEQQYIVANSVEAGSEESMPSTADVAPAEKPVKDGKQAETRSVLTIRTVRRETGEVVRTTKAPWTSQMSDWPMNTQGYVERSHEKKGMHWLLNLVPYGGNKGWALGEADSTCPPQYGFVTDTVLLISRCDPQEGWRLKASNTVGLATFWEMKIGK